MKNKRHYGVKCRGSEHTVGMGPKRKVVESMESKRKVTKTMRPKKVNKRLTTEDSVVGNRGIERLPSELLQHVFSHLRKPDLAQAALVCRKWGGVAADPRLWNRFTFPLTITCRQLSNLAEILECPRFSMGIRKVDLHQCDISSAHIAALSGLFPRGLQSIILGRNCKLVGVKAQLMEELGTRLEEITVESSEITQTQWKGLLQGLANSTKLRKLQIEPLPPKLSFELVNLLEKASMKVTTLALATIWPSLVKSIGDGEGCAVTNLDLHGVDLGPIDGPLLACAFFQLTTLDISYCAVPVGHLEALLTGLADPPCKLSSLNLEGVENLKRVDSFEFSQLCFLDKLNISNTGVPQNLYQPGPTNNYYAYLWRIMKVGQRTKLGNSFPSELSFCSEKAICTFVDLPHIFARVRVLNISDLSFEADMLVRIFKRLTAEFQPLDLEDLTICDTSLNLLETELLVAAILRLKKANIARCSLSYETVSHLLEEVGKVDLGANRLRELDVRRNTSGVDVEVVRMARWKLDVLKI